MGKVYPFSAYDSNLCLKPDLGMWLVFAFLLRPYLVPLLSVVNRKDKMGLINLVYADRYAMVFGAIAAIPAIFVLYAFTKRAPEATDNIKRIWQRGRELLLAATLLNVLVVFFPVLVGLVDQVNTIGWVQCGICIFIIYYLFSDKRVRDTFADFPKPPEPDLK